MVELNINIPSINPSRVSYVTNTTGMFSLTDLQPNILIYNLKVVSEDTTIGMTHPGSFTVPLSGIMFVDTCMIVMSTYIIN